MLHKFLHSLGLVPPVELDLNEQKHIIMEEYERGWAVRAAQVSIFFRTKAHLLKLYSKWHLYAHFLLCCLNTAF